MAPTQAFHFFPNQHKHRVLVFGDLALKVPRHNAQLRPQIIA